MGAISQGLAVISQGLGATQKSPGFWVTSNIPASWRTFKVLAPPELDSGVLEPPRLEGSFLEASQARFGFNFSVLEPLGLGCGVLEPLRAVPRCVEVRFGENQWWAGRQTTHLNGNDFNDKFWRRLSRIHAPKPRPEQTARSAVRGVPCPLSLVPCPLSPVPCPLSPVPCPLSPSLLWLAALSENPCNPPPWFLCVPMMMFTFFEQF